MGNKNARHSNCARRSNINLGVLNKFSETFFNFLVMFHNI
nr:MAG TPA: hypothetical protein [Caudoviricetes sp.]